MRLQATRPTLHMRGPPGAWRACAARGALRGHGHGARKTPGPAVGAVHGPAAGGALRNAARIVPHCRTVRARSDGCADGGRDPSTPAALLRQGHSEWQLRPAAAPVRIRGCGGAQDALQAWLRGHAKDVRLMILPRGYPRSVSPGYAGYTGWLAAGLFAHSFTVMVSTNALLSGFFAEMSAASWLMKDLIPPLLAGALATNIRTLEANPKKWLGAACFANSLLGCVEFMIPHLLPKESWMALAICTNVGKMTGYLVIGASRAVLQKTLATGDNLGEITAKLGTLGMLMHCFGAATALTLTQFLGFWGQLAAISAGAAVGFYAPMRASQCVVMSNVSTASLRRVVRRWVAARDGATPWACPSPGKLHDELAARWSVVYSLAARASAWRELLHADTGVQSVGSVSLHVGPSLSSAADVASLAQWRATLREEGMRPPSAWTLGAGGQGRLMLLFGVSATAADVVEGFAVAWLVAHLEAATLRGGREAASAGLAAVSVASLPEWRREAAALRESMESAGWHCGACNVDDVTRRVEWAGEE